MPIISHTEAFLTAGLPGELAGLQGEFPGWEISYAVLTGGDTWAMPRGVTWTAVSGDLTETADSAVKLAGAMRRAARRA